MHTNLWTCDNTRCNKGSEPGAADNRKVERLGGANLNIPRGWLILKDERNADCEHWSQTHYCCLDCLLAMLPSANVETVVIRSS